MHATLELLANEQFGLVSYRQALELLGRGALRHRIDKGEFTRFDHRVLAFRGAHSSWSQLAMGKLLQFPRPAALSHVTAGFVWELEGLGLRGKPPTCIDVTATSLVHASGCTMHRARRDFPNTLTRKLWVTTLPRTMVDLADVLRPTDLEKALDSARRKHKTFDDEFKAYLTAFSNPGRRSLPLLLDLFRQRTAPVDSSLEVEVLQVLRAEKFPPPVNGFSIYDEHRRYVMKVDHAWVELKVALHDDSFAFHGNRAAFERDVRQRTTLETLGWRNVVVTKRSLHQPHWKDALRKLLTRQTSLPLR